MQVDFIGWWNQDMHAPDTPEMFKGWEEDQITHRVLRREYDAAYHFLLPDWDPNPGLMLGPVNGERLFRVVKGK